MGAFKFSNRVPSDPYETGWVLSFLSVEGKVFNTFVFLALVNSPVYFIKQMDMTVLRIITPLVTYFGFAQTEKTCYRRDGQVMPDDILAIPKQTLAHVVDMDGFVRQICIVLVETGRESARVRTKHGRVLRVPLLNYVCSILSCLRFARE